MVPWLAAGRKGFVNHRIITAESRHRPFVESSSSNGPYCSRGNRLQALARSPGEGREKATVPLQPESAPVGNSSWPQMPPFGQTACPGHSFQKRRKQYR